MADRWERREAKQRRRKERPRSNRKGVELLRSSILASLGRVRGRGKGDAEKGDDDR